MRRIWTGVTKAVSCKRVCNINIRITMETMESHAKERTVHWPSPSADSFQANGFILFEIVHCGFFSYFQKISIHICHQFQRLPLATKSQHMYCRLPNCKNSIK